MTLPRLPRYCLLCAALSGLLLTGAAYACDVPVCEYALRHWTCSDYTVYYIHRGRETPADAEANALLQTLADGREGHANLRLRDLAADGAAGGLSADDRYALQQAAGQPLPRYLLISPRGAVVYSGTLTTSQVRALVRSPKTAALAEMLCRGARGVLLVLTGEDEASRQALQTAQQAAEAASSSTGRVGVVEVSRSSADELWLVRQLLGVEPDLAQIDRPMVFGVYGRCHVTEPYLGKGLTSTNLGTLIRFMHGPCTCEIKDANLGVDLLSDYDWEREVPEAGPAPRATEPGGYVEFEQ